MAEFVLENSLLTHYFSAIFRLAFTFIVLVSALLGFDVNAGIAVLREHFLAPWLIFIFNSMKKYFIWPIDFMVAISLSFLRKLPLISLTVKLWIFICLKVPYSFLIFPSDLLQILLLFHNMGCMEASLYLMHLSNSRLNAYMNTLSSNSGRRLATRMVLWPFKLLFKLILHCFKFFVDMAIEKVESRLFRSKSLEEASTMDIFSCSDSTLEFRGIVNTKVHKETKESGKCKVVEEMQENDCNGVTFVKQKGWSESSTAEASHSSQSSSSSSLPSTSESCFQPPSPISSSSSTFSSSFPPCPDSPSSDDSYENNRLAIKKVEEHATNSLEKETCKELNEETKKLTVKKVEEHATNSLEKEKETCCQEANKRESDEETNKRASSPPLEEVFPPIPSLHAFALVCFDKPGKNACVLYTTSQVASEEEVEACTDVIRLLNKLQLDFEIRDLSKYSEFKRELEELVGSSKAPQLFAKGKQIGGVAEIMQLHSHGELENILQGVARLLRADWMCSECKGEDRLTCPSCKGSGKLFAEGEEEELDDGEEDFTCIGCSGYGLIPCEACYFRRNAD